jgi:hypothetical protein
MFFETGGVFFWDETVLPRRRNRPETRVRLSFSSVDWDGQNAIYLRSHLDAVVQQISRCYGPPGGRAVIEASAAVLAVVSFVIFAAHALDAYRTG